MNKLYNTLGGKPFFRNGNQGSSSVPTLSDEFTGESLSSGWIWKNQASVTAAVANGVLTMTSPASTQNTYQIVQDVTALSGDFVAETRLLTQSSAAGIIAYNSANGRLEGASLSTYLNKVYFQRWTSFTAATNPYETPLVVPCFLRLSRIGTNIVLSYSATGGVYTTGLTDALATHIGAITHVGLSVQAGTIATFDYFRITQ